ncbi:MAG: spore protein [Defluviitaleaceae bacterium]|nr:spore protein [Defluviitaleaceae bacterium]
MDDRQIVKKCNQEAERITKATLNKFRYEAAHEMAPSLLTGYREGGFFGGFKGLCGGVSMSNEYLMKRVIEAQEKQMANQGK